MAVLLHQSLTNCQAFPVNGRFAAAPRTPFADRLAQLLRLWRSRTRERRELALLAPRDLRDIGVSTSDVWHEIRQPFWRSSLHR